ncbi:MAG TPA: TonB-dependent receptor [Steroidobacteraceae bacterium]|nr:TonB-dependent receptor [Steroidobacteraceae bacterium]
MPRPPAPLGVLACHAIALCVGLAAHARAQAQAPVTGAMAALSDASPSATGASATGTSPGASAGQAFALNLTPVTVQATAIAGAVIDPNLVPGTVQTLSAADLSAEGTASLTGAMIRQLGSINVDDNLDDPFQPDILYRGFEASPVLGTAEGLAVYQNGVRINEAFGDTVNWDLIPDLAIDHITIVSDSPVYGLNALGAGMSVGMKDGFGYHDAEADVSGGSFEQRAAEFQAGASSGHFAAYVAGKALDESGWREFAQDSVRQLYSVLSARTPRATFDLSFTGDRNSLAGQGAAPVQELAISRWRVFTGPQADLERLDFVTLGATLQATDSLSLQGVAYYRQHGQTVSNGNTSDYTACTVATYAGSLCQPDAATPLTGSAGQLLPDISAGGTRPIGENDFERIGAFGRGAALQASDHAPLGAHGNVFSAGATFDYAGVDFYSGTQIGVIDPQLTVLPSGLLVDTPEGSPFAATPVSLQAFDQYEGLYATDTFNVTRALAVTASGRYNVAQVDLRDRLGDHLTGDSRYTHFNPALGLTDQLSSELGAYAGLAQNARAPTASEIECSNPLQPCLLPSTLAGDPPTLRQVIAHTYELGLRGHLGAAAAALGAGDADSDTAPGAQHPALSWTLGVFRTDLHDDIYGTATSVSSGFFQNIPDTRRQGVEFSLSYGSRRWSAYIADSAIQASFRSTMLLPSPSNPHQNAQGDILVRPGDRLPGIPLNRFKLGGDDLLAPGWSVGAALSVVGSQYYFGDESNQNRPLPGYWVMDLHTSYRLSGHVQLFARLDNVLDARYATYGVYGDPTGVDAPGVPRDAVSNGPGVDDRFQSPAAPFAAYAGVRATL